MATRGHASVFRVTWLALALGWVLPAASIEFSQPELFEADTLAVIPPGRLPTSLAIPGPNHVGYPKSLYITTRAGTPNTGLLHVLADGSLSQFGTATHDDLRLTFGEGGFGDLLYGADGSWPQSHTDGVYKILQDGTPVLFSSLGGDNPDVTDILFGAGSSFGDFLYVASWNAGPGGSSYDYAISRLDTSGAFAGQLVYNASGPLFMARSTEPSFGDFIYYSVYSTGIFRVTADGTNSLFATIPTTTGAPLAFSLGGAFGNYLYTGGYPVPGAMFRVAPDGTVAEFATDVYVSDLTFDPSSTDLLVTDSLRGLVLRIKPREQTGVSEASLDGPPAVDIVLSSGNVVMISVNLKTPEHLRIGIFDSSGRRIGALPDEDASVGDHTYRWEFPTGGHMASGVYFVNVATSEWKISRKLVVLR